MALFNDNIIYKNDNIFSLTTDVYHDLLESYDYNLNVIKAIHNHDINDITLTESYEKQEILREGIGDVFKTIKEKLIYLWNTIKNFFKRIFGINKEKAKINEDFIKIMEESKDKLKKDIEILRNINNALKYSYEMYDYDMIFSENFMNSILKMDRNLLRDFDTTTIKGLEIIGKNFREKGLSHKEYSSMMRSFILHGKKDTDMTNEDFFEEFRNILRKTNNGNKFKKTISVEEICEIPIKALMEIDKRKTLYKKYMKEIEDDLKKAISTITSLTSEYVKETDNVIKSDILIGAKESTAYYSDMIQLSIKIVTTYNNIADEACVEYRNLYNEGTKYIVAKLTDSNKHGKVINMPRDKDGKPKVKVEDKDGNTKHVSFDEAMDKEKDHTLIFD